MGRLQDVPEVQRVFTLGRLCVSYKDMPLDDIRLMLEATNKLTEDLTGISLE